MSVQVENLEKNMAKLTIEVPAEELEKALEKAYQKQKKNISVPGFRKGKVPRAMVEKMYGPAGWCGKTWTETLQKRWFTGRRRPRADRRKTGFCCRRKSIRRTAFPTPVLV